MRDAVIWLGIFGALIVIIALVAWSMLPIRRASKRFRAEMDLELSPKWAEREKRRKRDGRPY